METVVRIRSTPSSLGDQMSATDSSHHPDFSESQSEAFDEVEEELEPGAAIRKMQMLAKDIYESTPGMTSGKLFNVTPQPTPATNPKFSLT